MRKMVPLLRTRGVPQQLLDQMLIQNPARIFNMEG